MQIKANYHTHTPKCHHASGAIRDYVESAVRAGLTTLGFSCHAPYSFDGDYVSWFRMLPSEAETYVSELSALREEFRDKIEIFIGFEAEYYPRHFDALLALSEKLGCDYLILGQHFTNNEYDGVYSGDGSDDMSHLDAYVSQVVRAMATGKFTYLAHPDLVRDMGKTDIFLEKMAPLCRASLEYDVPLEINLLGIADGRRYPNESFWKMVGEFGCRTVIGYDAHSPEALENTDALRRAFEIIEKYDLNFTENNITLRRPSATKI